MHMAMGAKVIAIDIVIRKDDIENQEPCLWVGAWGFNTRHLNRYGRYAKFTHVEGPLCYAG
jgi:hypothetical protein